MNLFRHIADMITKDQDKQIFRATVDDVVGNTVRILRTGATDPDTQYYPSMDSAGTLVAADEVVVLRIGSGYIVLGKVTR